MFRSYPAGRGTVRSPTKLCGAKEGAPRQWLGRRHGLECSGGPGLVHPVPASEESAPTKTIRSFSESVRSLADWLDDNSVDDDVAAITRRHVLRFLLSLRERGLKASSERVRYASLKQVFRFLIADGEIETNPMDGVEPPSVPQKPVAVLTDDELVRLVGTAEGLATLIDRRDAAIIRTFISTGARASEVASLRVEDVDLLRGRVWFHRTKGDKPREVGVGSETARAIDRYMRERRHHTDAGSEWLWLGRRGRFTTVGIAQMLEARGKLAGIDKHVHPRVRRRLGFPTCLASALYTSEEARGSVAESH